MDHVKFVGDSLKKNLKWYGLLKGALSTLRQFLATESSLSDEKCFLLHLKSSFRSQDV